MRAFDPISALRAVAVTAIMLLPVAVSGEKPKTPTAALIERIVNNWRTNSARASNYTYDISHVNLNFDSSGKKVRTNTAKFEVLVLEGLPYKRKVEVDGNPLSAEEAASEKSKYEQAIAERKDMTLEQKKGYFRRTIRTPIDFLPRLFNVKSVNVAPGDPENTIAFECEPRWNAWPKTDGERDAVSNKVLLWVDQTEFVPVKMVLEVIRDDAKLGRGSMLTYYWSKKDQVWLQSKVLGYYRVRVRHGIVTGGSEDIFSNYKLFHADSKILFDQ